MGFLKNIFSKKENAISTYVEFWDWFQSNEQPFFEVVKQHKNIEKDFLNKIAPKLAQLQEGFYYLTGMCNDTTAELILTAEGVVKNIAAVEELVKASPQLSNWKFTALKPETDIENIQITMGGYVFGSENLFFYAIDHKQYPDEVDIVIVYDDYAEKDKGLIVNGTFIFIDNYLGELNSVTTIDNMVVISKGEAKEALIPIAKLKAYLIWREKEFVEKYNGHRYNTENDSYSSMEAELENGKPLIAIVNSTLLEWESKASHPWIFKVAVAFNGANNNGMPDSTTYELLNQLEDEIMLDLKDENGYLNIGRQTADGEREIYFACKDFRKPALIMQVLILKYKGKLNINYELYKDKYWQSFAHFRPKH
ncbi:DUF695 domain-containing protein [Flavobacterium muglaense]|uniref:DUF695 domain-containing protein n=1 Tax=Flavobacterium muglaense TaxID=2764716 RepID=A0A923MYA3_9FLAO|nr:DUF695 domain-containing protein [Flavobacterium muglaense]MBC5837999.1 DUF695 domain-containing protein [Flavobacterium muglaense]MBC5844533.1 DUF695 domain-containing protein [Flavobacterium muglaense]